MGGVNPYIAPARVKKPTKKYRVTFLPLNVVAEVDPTKERLGHDGLPYSILDIAEGNGVDIDHSCGGVCACSTCHVYVREDMLALTPPMDADEDAMLEGTASERRPNSRLSCQIVVTQEMDGLVVHLPETQT